MSLPRILKLIAARPARRLELIHRGYVDLDNLVSPRPYKAMVSWGWLVQHQPVHFLDAYEGYRPTHVGLTYLLHEDEHHLIMVRPAKVAEVNERLMTYTQAQAEGALVNLAYEFAQAEARGWSAQGDDLPGAEEAVARLQRRGYVLLQDFQQRHGIGTDELIVSGVLRYLEHRSAGRLPNMDVGPKAKHCLMCSTRWQRLFVRPDMESTLLELISIREA